MFGEDKKSEDLERWIWVFWSLFRLYFSPRTQMTSHHLKPSFPFRRKYFVFLLHSGYSLHVGALWGC